MVQRASQGISIALPAQGGILTPGQAPAENVLDKYKTARPLDGNGAAVVQSIFGAVGKLAGQAWQTSTEDAYVHGAASAGMLESEKELQADPLTRDWAVAGFRDTKGKLKQAKQEADYLANLEKLREKDIDAPGGLNDFLAGQRADYADTLVGMSRNARESSVAKRITYEQSAIAQYTKERKAYLYGVESKALQATFAPAIGRLEAALESGDDKSIQAARDNVATVFTGDVWANPRLSGGDRVALTGELLDRLFVTSDTGTYNRLEAMGVLGQLPAEMQTKYAEKYRDALQQNDARRFAEYHDQLTTVLANSSDPNNPNFPDQALFSQVIDKGILIGALKGKEGMNYKTEYLVKAGKKNDQHGLGIAYSTGNQDFIFSRGKTVQDAVNAYEAARFSEGRTTEQVAMGHITIGATKGWPEAYQRAGALLAPVFNSILSTDKPPKPMLDTAKSIFTALDTLERSGQTVDFSQVLAGIPEAQRGDVLSLRARMAANEEPATAIAAVADQRARTAQLTPSMRAGISTAQGKTAAKLMEEMQTGGVFNETVKGLRGLVNMDTSERAMRPFVAPFADKTTAQLYVYNMQKNLGVHLSRAIQSNPHLQGDELKQVAMAGMAESLLDTSVGPVMLPAGADMHKFLNLPPVANKGNVAAAVAKLAAPTVEGASPVVNFEDGALSIREFKGTTQVAQRRVPASQVGDSVREILATDAKRVDRLSGAGIVRKDIASQAQVRFNGRNTASIDDGLMFKFRENLVTNEGVKGEAYPDLSNRVTGKNRLTVGVGITNTNDYFPKEVVKAAGDKLPQELIDSTFRDASNAAAKQGIAVLSKYGLDTNKWFLVTAELAYQSGPGTLQKDRAYNEMFDAAANGNQFLALEAFRRSPAYQMSGKIRRDHYERLIAKAMKG